MRKIYISIFLLIISTSAHSQISWQWAFAVSAGQASGLGVAEDALGNIYLTGYFSGTANFGGTTLTSQPTSNYDAFVAKYDSTQSLIWVKHFGTTQYSYGSSIGVDDSLNVYFNGAYNGAATLFKLDSNGNTKWQRSLSGSFSGPFLFNLLFVRQNRIVAATPTSLRVYNSAGVVKASANLAITCIAPGDNDEILVGNNQFFRTYDTTLTTLSTKNFGSTLTLNGIARQNKQVVATGSFNGTLSIDGLSASGSNDIFVAKFDSTGTCNWLKRAGGGSTDKGNSVVIGTNGKAYVAGYYRHSATFDTLAVGASGLFEEIFVAEYNLATGSVISVATAGGVGDHDIAYGMTECKADGTMLVTGTIYDQWGGVNFGNILINSPSGNTDPFLAKTARPEVISSISGTITNGGNPTYYALTRLYKVNPVDSTHTLINKQLTPATGQYSFAINEKGTYAVKAVYFNDGYINTYYPSTYIWNLATHLLVTKDTAITNIDISLISLPNNNDSNSLSGTVLGPDSLPKRFVDVLLVDDISGIPIDYCMTDTFGYYQFDSIAPSYYRILVDTAGMFMDSYHVVWVVLKTSTANVYGNLDYIIKPDKVYPIANTIGVSEPISAIEARIFPNPASDNFVIEIGNPDNRPYYASLYSQKGERLAEAVLTEKCTFDTGNLAAGLYVLRIDSDMTSSYFKVMVQH